MNFYKVCTVVAEYLQNVNFSKKINSHTCHFVIFALLSCYLLIDAINGWGLESLGVDLKISVLYKSGVLLLLLTYLLIYRPIFIVLTLIALLGLNLGEFINIIKTGNTALSIFSFLQSIKIVTPFLVFFFFKVALHKRPDYIRYVYYVFNINLVVFMFNIALGWFGIGFSTYDIGDGQGVGFKGFFFAGNEVAGVFMILSAYLLSYVLSHNKKHYITTAIVIMVIGFTIATKAAVLSALILIVSIPLVSEKYRLFRVTKMKVYYLLALFIGISIFIIFIWPIVSASGLSEKIQYVYNKHGLLGVILSNRDIFARALAAAFVEYDSFTTYFFGNGMSYYAVNMKVSAELDIPDLMFWSGLLGVSIVLFYFFIFLYYSGTYFFKAGYDFAPTVFFTNVLLFFISNFSGHIFTSGMLGIIWGAFNILALHKNKDTV